MVDARPAATHPAAVVVLAAGAGTRMKSALPKVLHSIGGRSLLGHVLAAAAPLGAHRTLVVVGHGADQVIEQLPHLDPSATAVLQTEQRGTGHAVRTALDSVKVLYPDGVVVVLPGDTPLLSPATLHTLVREHLATGAAATVLTAVVADPTGYGRVVRAADGAVVAIVEHKDATAAERALAEVNTSVYAFTVGPLQEALLRLTTSNAQGEEYLTDVVALHVAAGLTVSACIAPDPVETAGVNDRVQLSLAGAALRDRVVARHQRDGVTVVDPPTTWIDVDVLIESDVTLLPGVRLHGTTSVQRGARIGPDCTLTDTLVRAGATVASSTCVGAEVGEAATVGPYAYLRPGARLGRRAKVGGFVEVKNSSIGDDSKVPHLSYVGDATIGRRSNIGAATVVVNYDGVAKHRTTIGDDVRVGSDSMLVAPVTIGDNAYTAAGSVITEDVPAGALAVGRARQVNKEGWTARNRPAAKKEKP